MAIPRLKLFSAYNAAVAANGMDAQVLDRNAHEIFAFTQAYIQEFHPEVAPHVYFDYDRPDFYSSDTPIGSAVQQLMSVLGVLLRRSEVPSSLGKTADDLRAMGANHGGAEKSLFYGAIHPIVFGDVLVNRVGIMGIMGEQADARVTIGGTPEKRFNRVRQALSDYTRAALGHLDHDPSVTPAATARMISVVGDKAVYYTDPEGDLRVDAIASDKRIGKLSKVVKAELTALEEDVTAAMAAKGERVDKKQAWAAYVEFVKRFATPFRDL